MADNLETIKCPACGKEMTKIFIPSEGIYLDICTQGCGGIYFDNREFKKFDEQNEDIADILKSLEGKEFEKVDENKVRICPVCGSNMVKNYSSIKKEVQVDDCYFCGGKFLDHGELKKIRAEYETESQRGEDTVKFMYSVVGSELKEVTAHAEMAKRRKSMAKSLFDRLFY